MNQILQYVILAGISGVVFSAVLVHFTETLQLETISQHDKNEIEKKRVSEYLKVIDIMENPLRIDVINLGSSDVIIKKLFVGGIIDDNYTINGNYSKNIIPDKIITIKPSIMGDTILLISENYKKFEFR